MFLHKVGKIVTMYYTMLLYRSSTKLIAVGLCKIVATIDLYC